VTDKQIRKKLDKIEKLKTAIENSRKYLQIECEELATFLEVSKVGIGYIEDGIEEIRRHL